jgi:transposase-like protein
MIKDSAGQGCTAIKCPACGSGSCETLGAVEADIAVLGTDEYVQRCHDCGAEWVREKGGNRTEMLRR